MKKTNRRGGSRARAGRNKVPEIERKVPFNTRLPLWVKQWLVSADREESAARLVLLAIIGTYKLKQPKE